ncbi:hypothetical protein SAMN05444280_11958 [Tangfeifania diversioriginum]|uniref:Transcriptional regulator n=1 Tax=Tangfeifania diversioriginum TaxID=1168035 RepID=A0A1M6JA35_9BACT|nr:hypothetical protein [Tangfeifania diversioriginum]SHJ43568.1 hypothetical protein SAMN05444280_11958 [Tangfeifania diversioriginum]
MIDVIVRSKTRLKLLTKFFLFEEIEGYMQSMVNEFDESSNVIRVELNRFVKAGLISTRYEGRKRLYQANTSHPLYPELNRIMRKTVGIDQIVHIFTTQTERLEALYVFGRLANGIESETIQLAFVGSKLNKAHIENLVERTESIINRKVVCYIFTQEQMQYLFKENSTLLIWKKEE